MSICGRPLSKPTAQRGQEHRVNPYTKDPPSTHPSVAILAAWDPFASSGSAIVHLGIHRVHLDQRGPELRMSTSTEAAKAANLGQLQGIRCPASKAAGSRARWPFF